MELIKFNVMAIGYTTHRATEEYMNKSFNTGETFVVYINPMQIVCISDFHTWKGNENKKYFTIECTNENIFQLRDTEFNKIRNIIDDSIRW